MAPPTRSVPDRQRRAEPEGHELQPTAKRLNGIQNQMQSQRQRKASAYFASGGDPAEGNVQIHDQKHTEMAKQNRRKSSSESSQALDSSSHKRHEGGGGQPTIRKRLSKSMASHLAATIPSTPAPSPIPVVPGMELVLPPTPLSSSFITGGPQSRLDAGAVAADSHGSSGAFSDSVNFRNAPKSAFSHIVSAMNSAFPVTNRAESESLEEDQDQEDQEDENEDRPKTAEYSDDNDAEFQVNEEEGYSSVEELSPKEKRRASQSAPKSSKHTGRDTLADSSDETTRKHKHGKPQSKDTRSHNPPATARVRSKNFLPGERNLLLQIMGLFIDMNKVPPRQGFDWNAITAEFNKRRQKGEGRTIGSQQHHQKLADTADDRASAALSNDSVSRSASPFTTNKTNELRKHSQEQEEHVTVRTAPSLRRFFNRICNRQIKGGGFYGDENVIQSFERAMRLNMWEERNKKSGFVTDLKSPRPQLSSQLAQPQGIQPIAPIESIPATPLYNPEAHHPPTQPSETHPILHNHRQSNTVQNQAYHNPAPPSAVTTPYGYHRRQPSGNSLHHHLDHEADADAEDNEPDDDVQSKHSHTVRSQGGGDIGFSQLFNDDVYGDFAPLGHNYSSGYHALDGMFTPNYHGTTSGREGTSSMGLNMSAKRRRPTTSSTGYESSGRRKFRRMTRGLSQDGTEFLNFASVAPSTPGPSFAQLQASNTPGGAGVYGPAAALSSGIASGEPTAATVPATATTPAVTTGGPATSTSANAPPFPNVPTVPSISGNSGRYEDVVLMKDRMILQLQSTIYTMFQDLRESTERLQRLSESEARLIAQEQRSIAEVRMMEVGHREQIQNYEERIHDLHKENSKLRRRHSREIKRLMRLVPPSLRPPSTTSAPPAPSFAQTHSDDHHDRYFHNAQTRQSAFSTSGRLVSPPPFSIPSPTIGLTLPSQHASNDANTSNGAASAAASGHQASTAAGSSTPAGTGAGSLKKHTSFATPSTQQAKSVKLLSRDTIIKDTFFRDRSSSHNSSGSDSEANGGDEQREENNGNGDSGSGEVEYTVQGEHIEGVHRHGSYYDNAAHGYAARRNSHAIATSSSSSESSDEESDEDGEEQRAKYRSPAASRVASRGRVYSETGAASTPVPVRKSSISSAHGNHGLDGGFGINGKAETSDRKKGRK